MPISVDTPKHLVIGARSGFLTSMKAQPMPYTLFTEDFPLDSAEQVAVDLGAAPMPKQSPSGMTLQDFIEKSITLKPLEWDITVFVEYKLSADDQTRSLRRKVESAGINFQKHINKRAFEFLNAGDAGSFGLCYDGQFMFDSDHVDKGAQYQTAQDNVSALALSATNFNTVWADSKGFKDDQGEFVDIAYNLLIVPPLLRDQASQIADNPLKGGTGNNDINPFQNEMSYVASPELDDTAWILTSTSEGHKPLILAMREEPNLIHTEFQMDKPGGGWWVFKFWAQYEFFYGDWRLAHMGNT